MNRVVPKPAPASSLRRRCAVVPVLALSLLAATAAMAESVGQVSLLIGDAELVHADGRRSALTRAAEIHVGDRIETGANGHVHLRFVDKAAVSIRPDSTLQVQAYHYDAQQPGASEVRLKLERGSSRSISGAATEFDKSRFRLNTPIAAIGVRGTDFVVQSDLQGVRATVADGAIVVTPYGAACSAAGLGPCSGLDSRELSAGMGRLMAEVRPGDRSTQLVATADMAYLSSALSGDRRDEDGQREALAAARASGLLAAEPTRAQQQRGNDRTAAEMLTLAAVKVPDLNRAPSLDSQLVWGRWAILPATNDRLTVPFSLARLDRHVTVADQEAGLFRANQTVPGEQFPTTLAGTVQFRLTRASATYESPRGLEAAHVMAGNLTVDFTRRNFATALDLTSASGVPGSLRMAGDIRNDGIFSVVDTTQRVAGAIAFDGKEAGYLFETGSLGQLFRGRTLWGVGP